ncbi:hypothetical protein [Paracoccus lutimaris]|uniref:Uncharacterized protein n=1 Tax=Paracoccus lutimaris TaxID=1490030 RepID=A0A368YC80_9RHOB|nr:hypothetical protein [Paracoccus lutimaris]RCW77812.1 hypothetical protein DFP89_1566 [Paracoccus lutimaris]
MFSTTRNLFLGLIPFVWHHLPFCLRHAVSTLSALAGPARRSRDMSATALNDRRSAGARCRGFLGRPAVTMLAG